MTRECFHFVSLLRMRSKLMHENILRHEYGAVSPITKLSDVSSGGESPMMHAGKSNIGMLCQIKNHIKFLFHSVVVLFNDIITYTFFDPT